TMLLILTAEMIYKYLIAADSETALTFGDFNLAAAIAICHGWCYVVYLIGCFWLNQQMRWSLGRYVVLALAGVMPVMSFILERRIHRQVDAELEAAVVVAPKSLRGEPGHRRRGGGGANSGGTRPMLRIGS